MRLWGRLSHAQRIGCVAWLASFVVLLLGSLVRGPQPVGNAGWWDWSVVVLVVAVPAAAMALSWWIATTPNASQTMDADGRDRRLSVSRRLALPLALGLATVGRGLDRRIPTALSIAVLVWWLATIAVMVVVIPRLARARA